MKTGGHVHIKRKSVDRC